MGEILSEERKHRDGFTPDVWPPATFPIRVFDWNGPLHALKVMLATFFAMALVRSPWICFVTLAAFVGAIALGITRWVVGRDGVLVRTLLHPRGRFFPHRVIAAASRSSAWWDFDDGQGRDLETTRIELRLRNGQTIRFPGSGRSKLVSVLNVLKNGAAQVRSTIAETSLYSAKDFDVLMERVRACTNQGEGFRVPAPPLSREELWAVFEDVTSWPVHRGIACIALGKPRDAEEERRFHAASHGTVAPGLSKLFTLVQLGADADLLEQALRGVTRSPKT